MKKLYFLILTVAALQLAVTSCKKDKKEDPAPSQTSTFQESISKKWMVSSQSGRISTSDYIWFEFNKNNRYIIAKKDGSFLYGTYTISSDHKTITLANFGVITITTVSTTGFNFTLTLNGSTTPITIFTTPSSPIASSTKTDLMCRGWKMTKLTMDTMLIYPDPSITKYEIILTKYGTYFVTLEQNGNTDYFSRLWQWKDGTETKLCYGDSTSTCNGQNEATVTEITNTSLKITETNSLFGTIKYEMAPL